MNYLKLGTTQFDFTRTYIMGIVNVTPDSFSDGGQCLDIDAALRHTEQLIVNGADIIDVGAESTRPGSHAISTQDQIKRLSPFLSAYSRNFDTPLSIDTQTADVAEWGLSEGGHMINDISAMRDPKMASVIAAANCPVVLMHMQNTPLSMQKQPIYQDIIQDILTFLQARIDYAHTHDIHQIIVDPGIGFGKTLEHNLSILGQLQQFQSLNCPVLIGTSKKSWIEAITGADVHHRLEETLASNVISVLQGAQFLRVHDVQSMKKAIQVTDAIKAYIS